MHHTEQARTKKILTGQRTRREIGSPQRRAVAEAGSAPGTFTKASHLMVLCHDRTWLWGGRKAWAAQHESVGSPTYSWTRPRAMLSLLE